MVSFHIYITVLKGIGNKNSIHGAVYQGIIKPPFQNSYIGKSLPSVLIKQLLRLLKAESVSRGEYDGIVIVDKEDNFNKERQEYLSSYVHTFKPFAHPLAKRVAFNSLNRCMLGLSYMSLFPLFLFLLFFVKKDQLSFIANEIGGTLSVLRLARNLKTTHIIAYGSAYRSSMNLLAYLCSKKKLKLSKICSANPLYLHYKYNVADTFMCVSPSQIEELKNEKFVNNWFVNKIMLLPNPKSTQLRSFFRNIDTVNEPHSYSIGFISSGFYIRNYRGHNKVSGEEFYFAEERLLDFLNNHFKLSKNKLLVLLHPLEKKKENYRVACEYYATKLKDIDYAISDQETNSLEYIAAADIYVSSSSTMNYDLLYCGAKVIFAPLGNQSANFPSYSTLNKISTHDSVELGHLLVRFHSLSLYDYYATNELKAYHHSQYQNTDVGLNHISPLNT